jgi:hypothetical protein
MSWIEPQFTPERRNRAGKNLAKGCATDDDLTVINNWRSSHGAALQTIKMLLKSRA